MLKLKSLLYIPIIFAFMTGFVLYDPILHKVHPVFYFILYPFVFLLLCFDFNTIYKKVVLLIKDTSYKYLFFTFCFMILNSFLLSVFGVIPVKTFLLAIFTSYIFGIIPIYLYIFHIVDKYISYKKFLNTIIFIYWIVLVLGIICYIGQYFSINIINTIFDFFANKKILKIAMDLSLKTSADYYAFGLPRLNNLCEEPTHYAQIIYLFLPLTLFVKSYNLISLKNPILDFLIKNTIIPLSFINLILTFSPIFLVLCLILTGICYCKKIILFVRKHFPIALVLFLFLLILIPFSSADVSGTYLSRIVKVITQTRSFEDLISADESFASRIMSYINIFIVFLQHPVTGCGIGNLPKMMYYQLQNSPVPLTNEIIRKSQISIMYGGNPFYLAGFFYQFVAENGIFAYLIFVFFIIQIYREIIILCKCLNKNYFEYKMLKVSKYLLTAMIINSFYNLTIGNRFPHIILAIIILTIYRAKQIYKRDLKIKQMQQAKNVSQACLIYNENIENINKE